MRLAKIALVLGRVLVALLPLLSPQLLCAQLPAADPPAKDKPKEPPWSDVFARIFPELPVADDSTFGFSEDRLTWIGIGNFRLTGVGFELLADRAAIVVLKPGLFSRTATAPADATPASFKIYCEGNILLTVAGQVLRADAIFIDGAKRTAKLIETRLTLDQPQRFQRERIKPLLTGGVWPSRDFDAGMDDFLLPLNDSKSAWLAGDHLAIAAATLELEQFDVATETSAESGSGVQSGPGAAVGPKRFFGEDVRITTCDFGVPHWSLAAAKLEATQNPSDEPAPAEESRNSYTLELERVRLRLWERPILPIPSVTWDTRWNRYIPLRRIAYSNSSKYGNRVETLWNGNLLLPRGWRRDLDLGLRLDYLSARGTGYGVELEYGDKPRKWSGAPERFIDLYGRATYFGIHDRGEDRNDLMPETEDRYRTRWHQRARFRTNTWVDLEYAVESDRNFLNEYYESEARGEKRPENLIYVRQPLADDIAATLLAKRRIVNYRTEVERLPEVSLLVVERPLGSSGFTLDSVARASYLRFQPDDLSPLPSEQMTRADLRNRLAYVVGRSTYGRLRPVAEVRGTVWEEDLERGNRIERFSVGVGANLAWHLSKQFPFQSRLWNADALKHIIEPELRYRSRFENNVDPALLFPFDATETVDREEVVTFALKQYVFARELPKDAKEPALNRHRKLLEADLAIDLFPDPVRDNARDSWGPLKGELLVSPYPGVGVAQRAEYNVEEGGRFDRYLGSVSYEPARGTVLSVGNRYDRHRQHSLTGSVRWAASAKYEAIALYEYDQRRRRQVNQLYGVLRHFHCWSMLLSLEVDEGEDDNVEFKIRFGPRELVGFFDGSLVD
ncbi:MAG: hypothetical protein ACKVX7_03020 [Planctomycetota bacterium]